MDRKAALQQLPPAHAEALRLHDAGRDELIPERLGIPPEAVGALLRVAQAKLASLLEKKAP
jgi:DNA-directed RNA polymerase specialized sigma24 family protein